jgi:site-specific DNA-methyltransferase (adenine-specific)
MQTHTGYPKHILEFSGVNVGSKERFHPSQKPVDLLEYLIKTYTNEGETVLDNCMGSGSTGVAAMNTGRKFIGIEQDEKYFEIAKQRINDVAFSIDV